MFGCSLTSNNASLTATFGWSTQSAQVVRGHFVQQGFVETSSDAPNSEQYHVVALCFFPNRSNSSCSRISGGERGHAAASGTRVSSCQDPKVADIILKHASTVVSIFAGGTATLGADLISSITSTNARNAIRAPTQVGCKLRNTVLGKRSQDGY